MIAALAFYAFAAVLIGSAVMVVTSRNPVHSVLFLILAFFNAAGLFLLAGAEFLAMILVIVYVGAVAVLFLFVVMMLDIDFARLREGFQRYAPIGALIGLVLLVQLVMVMIGWRMAPGAMALRLNETPADIANAEALGRILYTDYIYL
ncbi:MAG: NADH-quinone oxidoreductase subunit J, partial [Alphaproteobacteria bacterium]